MFKTYLRRIHLLLALASGLFLINLSLSGALLIYGKEIQSIINPQYWLLPISQNQNEPQVLPLSLLTKKIEHETQTKIQFIEQAENKENAWQVRLINKSYLSINPYNGDILLAYNYSDTFYGFVMSWHRWLLYSNNADEKPMQLWASIASLVFVIQIIMGLILWGKPKNRIKRLKVRWQAKNKIRFMQLHTTIGVMFCIPLILIPFSGMAFFWSAETKQIVEWLSLSKVQQHNFTPQLQQQNLTLKNSQALQLDKAYNTAKSALITGNVYRIYLPKDTKSALALRIKMPTESHAYSWSWADPYSGELLNSFDASKTSMATQVWNFKYKFHIGDFIGWPVKILWLLISLMPCFFVCSGIYLYIKRKYN